MIPKEIRLSKHALQRLEERKSDTISYNLNNIIDSNCTWYSTDDLIFDSNLYTHSLYVCRKSKEMAYLTNGDIEILYNKNTGVAITIVTVKDKFKPINKYIKY